MRRAAGPTDHVVGGARGFWLPLPQGPGGQKKAGDPIGPRLWSSSENGPAACGLTRDGHRSPVCDARHGRTASGEKRGSVFISRPSSSDLCTRLASRSAVYPRRETGVNPDVSDAGSLQRVSIPTSDMERFVKGWLPRWPGWRGLRASDDGTDRWQRCLATLISAGRDRMAVVSRNLPPTVHAGPAGEAVGRDVSGIVPVEHVRPVVGEWRCQAGWTISPQQKPASSRATATAATAGGLRWWM